MSSNNKGILKEISRMLFLSESSRKNAQDTFLNKTNNTNKKINEDVEKEDASNQELESLKKSLPSFPFKSEGYVPFPINYVAVMADRAGINSQLAKKFREDALNMMVKLKNKRSDLSYLDALKIILGDSTIIGSMNRDPKGSDYIKQISQGKPYSQIPEEVRKYGEDAIERFFINNAKNPRYAISEKLSKNELTQRGYNQLQFVARMAAEKPFNDLEAIFLEMNKNRIKGNAISLLTDFYKYATDYLIRRLTGREHLGSGVSIEDLDLHNMRAQAIHKLEDSFFGRSKDVSYDPSMNNIGAWAFTVLKNDIIDQIKARTTLKLRTGIDKKSGINISDVFEQNNWDTWKSTLNPKIASGIDFDKIKSVKEISDGIWEYKFKTPHDAYAEFVEASDGESNNIFLSHNLVSSEIKKLRNYKAQLSVGRDVGFEDPGFSEQPDIDPEDEEAKISSGDLYSYIADWFLENDPKFQSGMKSKSGKMLKDKEEVGRALFHILKDGDWKYFLDKEKWGSLSNDDKKRIIKIGEEKYGKKWFTDKSGKIKFDYTSALGDVYIDESGDIYEELEPFIDSKMVLRKQKGEKGKVVGGGSKIGKEISQEEIVADQKNRGVDPDLLWNNERLKPVNAAASRLINNEIDSDKKIKSAIEQLVKSEGINESKKTEKFIMKEIKISSTGKAKILSEIIGPKLVKLGFSSDEIKNDFKINKSTGKLINLSEEKRKKYESIILNDSVLYRTYNIVANNVDKKMPKKSVLSESTESSWEKRFKKYGLSDESIEKAEKSFDHLINNWAPDSNLSNWIKNKSKEFLYVMDKFPYEYQNGNKGVAGALSGLFMTQFEGMIYDNLIKYFNKFHNYTLDTRLHKSLISDTIVSEAPEAIESSLKNYDPSSNLDFFFYIINPGRSAMITKIARKIEKKLDTKSVGDEEIPDTGFDPDSDSGHKSDAEIATSKERSIEKVKDHILKQMNLTEKELDKYKDEIFNIIKSMSTEKLANTYLDFAIKGETPKGLGSVSEWWDLVRDSSTWSRFGGSRKNVRKSNKSKILKKALIPYLKSKGFDENEIKSNLDKRVDSNTGMFKMPEDKSKIKAYEEALSDNKSLKKAFDLIVYDKDMAMNQLAPYLKTIPGKGAEGENNMYAELMLDLISTVGSSDFAKTRANAINQYIEDNDLEKKHPAMEISGFSQRDSKETKDITIKDLLEKPIDEIIKSISRYQRRHAEIDPKDLKKYQDYEDFVGSKNDDGKSAMVAENKDK